MAVNIYCCIGQAVAEPLSRQIYQAPVSNLLLASVVVSGFLDACVQICVQICAEAGGHLISIQRLHLGIHPINNHKNQTLQL